MSFGGSQGTVRYAVILQDQASAPIQRLNQSFTSMGTAMTSTTQKTNAFNSAIASNARTFTASVTPIKNTGNALNQLSVQQKTIGSQLASIGSGFKNNALAIGAAASSVLGLYQNYANLSSAQNAANKSATAAKAAQNSVAAATKNLSKAIDKYGAGSKEAKAAQDKLTVAQERSVNKTESAKIAQDNLNQTMADFGINILPNVVLAGGSIASIFDNINLKGKGLSGIVSKLGGALGGLIPSFGGIGSKSAEATKGFDSISTSSKAATGGVTGLQTALVGGLVITGAAVIIQQVQAVQDAFDQAGIKFAKMKAGMLFSPTELNMGFAQLDELMTATGMSAVQLGEDMEGAKKKFVEAGGKIDAAGNIIWGSFNKAQQASKNLKAEIDKVPPSMNKAATSTDAWVNMMVKAIQSADPKKMIEFNKAFEASGQSMDRYQQIVKEADAILKQYNTTVQLTTPALNKSTEATKKATVEVGTLWKTWEVGGGKMASVIAGFGTTINNLSKKFLALSNAQKDLFGTKFTQNVMQFTDLLKNWGGGKVTQTVEQTNQKLKEQSNLVTLTNNSAKSLNKTWEVDAGKIAADNAAKALEKAKAAAEKFKQSLAAAQTDIKGVFKIDSNADKILKDLIKKLPNKAEKEIKLQLKFGQSVDDNKKAFNDLMFEATQVSDKTADSAAKQIIKTIDDKFKGAKGSFAGLRSALQTAIADPNTPEALKTLLMNFNWDAVGSTTGKKIGTAINQGIVAAANAGGGLASLWETGGKGGKGIVIPAPVIPAPITTAFDSGVKTLTTNVANISKTVPAISVNNKPAIKQIDVIAKRISDLTKINPQIPVNNKPAIKAIDAVAKRIDGLSKINPAINVNNKPAIKAIDVIAKRITSLPTGDVTVKVHYDTSSKPAGVKADSGNSSKFDSGGTVFSKTNSGTRGDTVVNLNISGNEIVNEQKLSRRIKASQGTARYRFGLG